MVKLQYILLLHEVQKRFVVLSISKGYFQWITLLWMQVILYCGFQFVWEYARFCFGSILKLYGKLIKSKFYYIDWLDSYFIVIKCRIYPIIPALFLIRIPALIFASYFSQNYSGIMCACLHFTVELMFIFCQLPDYRENLLCHGFTRAALNWSQWIMNMLAPTIWGDTSWLCLLVHLVS